MGVTEPPIRDNAFEMELTDAISNGTGEEAMGKCSADAYDWSKNNFS
jgi:hypothetical protein